MALIFRGVEISDLVEGKINGKHHVTADEVCEAIGNHWELGWLAPESSGRKRRLLVRGPTDQGRILNIGLYPVDEDLGEWRLATAFPERDWRWHTGCMAREEEMTPEEFQALLAVATPVEGSGRPVVRRPDDAGVGYAPVPASILRATFNSSSLAKSVVDVRTMRRTDVSIS